MQNKSILAGSEYFFKDCPGYVFHDRDKLVVTDNLPAEVLRFKDGNDDVFLINRMSADEYVASMLSENVLPMRCGKFLIPEFNNEVGFTIEHLKKIGAVFDRIDDKHRYEKIIYESYIENNGFFLTNEQKMKAYEEYKKYRDAYK